MTVVSQILKVCPGLLKLQLFKLILQEVTCCLFMPWKNDNP